MPNLTCPHCKKYFSSEQALHYHLEKKKLKCWSVIKCMNCNEIFRTKTSYNIHKCVVVTEAKL